ncbi:hypothetical protein DFP72DRAFT_916386, partial [Ephemerocybe angulata]
MAPHTDDITLTELDLPQDLIRLFRSFGTLSKAEKTSVQNLMKDYTDQLANHPEARISRAAPSGNPSSGSLPQKDRLETKLSALQSLFAPIRRLPPEILVEIFRNYLSPVLDHPTIQLSPTPRTLGSICSFWRTTTLSSPILWTHVSILGEGDSYMEPDVTARHAEGARLWMDRLGQLPWSLSIQLDLHASSQGPSRVPLADVLRHPATTRLRELGVIADAPVTGVEGQTFPALESLLVRWRQTNHHMYSLESVFPIVPKLKKLVVVNVITLNSFTDKLPWSNLTHLFIEGTTFRKWRMIIGLCTSLQEGCFSIEDPSHHIQEIMSSGEPITPAVLPHLTRLTFLNRPPLQEDFRELSFPALEEFNIVHGSSGLDEWTFPPTLHAFQDIRRLTIAGKTEVDLPTTIFHLLEATHSLLELRLDINCDVDQLFKFLMYDHSKVRLGLLENLDVSFTVPSSPDSSTPPLLILREMLRSRSPEAARRSGSVPVLQSVAIRLRDPPVLLCDIEAACRQMGFLNGEVNIEMERPSVPISSITLPRDSLGGYKHWDDGLTDFLLPNGSLL